MTRTRTLHACLAASLLLLLGVTLGVVLSRGSREAHAQPISLDFATLAQAAVVSQSGGLTVMTSEVPGEDVLLVLDSRNEELFVYRADSKVGVQLLQRYPVPQLFVDARARSRGTGP